MDGHPYLDMDEDVNQFENIEDNVKLFEIQEVDQYVIKIIINELNTYSKDIHSPATLLGTPVQLLGNTN